MTVPRVLSALAGLLALAASQASGQSSPPAASPTVLVSLTSTLTIRGSTTIGARWHCTAHGLDSRVAVAERSDTGRSALPDVRGVTVHLPVSMLRCQSGAMERAMRRALKADRDTAALAISGRFEITDDLQPARPDERLLVGGLRVAGTERNVLLRARIAFDPDGSLRVQSIVPLLLTSFGMELPRVLFGAVRARDGVIVEVDLRYPRPSFSGDAASPY